MMRDKRSEKYVSGIGLHYYMDLISSLETLDILHDKYPSQEIVYTESSINPIMLMFIDSGNVTRREDIDKEPRKRKSLSLIQ